MQRATLITSGRNGGSVLGAVGAGLTGAIALAALSFVTGHNAIVVLLTYILAGAFVTAAVAVLPLVISALADRVAKMPVQTVSRGVLLSSR